MSFEEDLRLLMIIAALVTQAVRVRRAVLEDHRSLLPDRLLESKLFGHERAAGPARSLRGMGGHGR